MIKVTQSFEWIRPTDLDNKLVIGELSLLHIGNIRKGILEAGNGLSLGAATMTQGLTPEVGN